jgi:prolyl-tRNA synthetase
VLYDEREEKGPGEKFSEADLIGCPIRLVVSDKTLAEESVEYKKRNEDKSELIKLEKLISKIVN